MSHRAWTAEDGYGSIRCRAGTRSVAMAHAQWWANYTGRPMRVRPPGAEWCLTVWPKGDT